MMAEPGTRLETGSYYDLIKSKQESRSTGNNVKVGILRFAHCEAELLRADFSLSP